MYDYISGSIAEINPAETVIDNHGIGYHILITLQTYDKINKEKEIRLYIHHLIRDDEEALYGFYDREERRIFTLLIGVSGIGPNTARLMLSSLTTSDIKAAVMNSDVNKIKGVKGIGLKTAQKVIIELKDKIAKGSPDADVFETGNAGAAKSEAVTALVTLGFNKQSAEKALDKVLKESPSASLEDLIKKALKML